MYSQGSLYDVIKRAQAYTWTSWPKDMDRLRLKGIKKQEGDERIRRRERREGKAIGRGWNLRQGLIIHGCINILRHRGCSLSSHCSGRRVTMIVIMLNVMLNVQRSPNPHRLHVYLSTHNPPLSPELIAVYEFCV